MTRWTLGVAALACSALAATLAAAPALAKHDSNTLSKLGKALQYPINKTSQNTSVLAHRVAGKNSVVHRRNGNKTYRSVVTPKGRIHRLHRVRAH